MLNISTQIWWPELNFVQYLLTLTVKETVPGLKASFYLQHIVQLALWSDSKIWQKCWDGRQKTQTHRISSKPITSQAQNRISAGVTHTDNTDTQRDTILSMSSHTHTHRLTHRLRCRHLESYQNLILESKSHFLWFRGGRRWRHLLSIQIAPCMNRRERNLWRVLGHS